MRIEQLQLFGNKGSFNSSDFESSSNDEVFRLIGQGVSNAFSDFAQYDITNLCNTTRSNILNDLVASEIGKIESEQLIFHPKLTNTRRSFAVLEDKYILFFKKSPVSNVKTNQDDLIKNQELGKHILFIVYHVDEFWSSISTLEFQYFSSPGNVSYKYDITGYLVEPVLELVEEEIVTPNVQLKDNINIPKQAQ
ncbi:hypothetical protein [Ekhidna sp.]|uniref:hypothetical protein n=1 Tax=Ekhidna sp. TaxID=2608089 RepID=UPI003299DDE3